MELTIETLCPSNTSAPSVRANMLSAALDSFKKIKDVTNLHITVLCLDPRTNQMLLPTIPKSLVDVNGMMNLDCYEDLEGELDIDIGLGTIKIKFKHSFPEDYFTVPIGLVISILGVGSVGDLIHGEFFNLFTTDFDRVIH
jgi:hypothetical protein